MNEILEIKDKGDDLQEILLNVPIFGPPESLDEEYIEWLMEPIAVFLTARKHWIMVHWIIAG